MHAPSMTLSHIISETTTRKRNPNRGFLIGFFIGALFWGGINMMFSDPHHMYPLDPGIISLFAAPFAGALFGGIAGTVGALAGGWSGRSIVDRLIGGLIGALINGIGWMVFAAFLSRLYELYDGGLSWALPQSLVLLISMIPGILGGVCGAHSYTTTRATCAACGDLVQPDTPCCPHCGAAFDWSRRVETFADEDSQAITLNAEYAKAYNNRGNVYRDQNKLDMALKDYTQAISLDPSDAEAYNNRGLVYHVQNELDMALKDFDKVITLDPNDADAYYNRGVIHKRRNKVEAAIADFRKARNLCQNSHDRQEAINWLKALGAI